MFEDAWKEAAEDPKARALKARRARPKPKSEPPAPPEVGPESGDLF